jgi:hypothetical protein
MEIPDEVKKNLGAQEARLNRLTRRILRNEDIEELLELAEEAIGYTPAYFRQKWSMESRLDNLRNRLLTPDEADLDSARRPNCTCGKTPCECPF